MHRVPFCLSKDLEFSVGYVKKNCSHIIDIFSIPDEKEQDNLEQNETER